jgi:hypothetical protein
MADTYSAASQRADVRSMGRGARRTAGRSVWTAGDCVLCLGVIEVAKNGALLGRLDCVVGSLLEVMGAPVCPEGFPYPSTVAGPVTAGAPVGPEEFSYPSTVTGAVPAGAPATVSWAATGLADKTAQTAAVDRNVGTKRFI